MRKIMILAFVALLVPGCSVKEDRSACPAWLQVSLSAKSIALAGECPVSVSAVHGEGIDTLTLTSLSPEGWVKVGRSRLRVDALLRNGAGLTVPWGSECDSLWAYSKTISLHSDEGRLEVTLHKRFATVWFAFDSEPDYAHSRLTLRSDIAGTDITRMNPVQGEFRCLLKPSGGKLSVRLPAQRSDSSLELECTALDGGGLLWNWDLGSALRNAGYDWNAEDLADIRVRVTLMPLSISVETIPWNDGNPGLKLEI